MSKIKLVMTDLDDTLLNSDKKISEANYQAIDRLIEKGVLVVPTTGRYYGGIPDELHEHTGIKYLVSSNGAMITNNETKEVITMNAIATDILYDIVAMAEAKAINIILVADGQVVLDERIFDNPKYEKSDFLARMLGHGQTTGDVLNFLKETDLTFKKVDLGFSDLEFRNELYAKLKEYPGISAVSSHASNIEITEANTSKGSALEYLIDLLELDRSEVLAIGDNDNDISMLQLAGIGVAMDNASEQVKSHSDAVTDNCNNDGFAKAINKVFDF